LSDQTRAVLRYKMVRDHMADCFCEMDTHDSGDYVLFEDCDSAVKQAAEWKSKAEAYNDLFTQENARAVAAEARLAAAELAGNQAFERGVLRGREESQALLAEAERDAARWRYAYAMRAGDFLKLVSKAQKGHPGGLNALIDAALAATRENVTL
jgi:hypothetical protein